MLVVELDAWHLPFLAFGAGFLALAAWLLVLDFPSRLNRALALTLILEGAPQFTRPLDSSTPEGFALHALGRVMWAAAPFALVYFILAYEERFGTRQWRRWAFIPLLLVSGAVVLAVARDLAAQAPGSLPSALADSSRHPLYDVATWLGVLVPSFAAYFFGREGTRHVSGPRRRALLLVSLAFALGPMFLVLHLLVPDVMPRISLPVGGYLVALVPVVLLAAHMSRVAARRDGDAPRAREAKRFLVALALPVASVMLLALVRLASLDMARLFMVAFMGVWMLAFPVLASYALVRHRLFDIDVKLRWGISRGTVAGVFLAVFFIVAETSENLLSDSFGWAAGGVAAGLLLFAIAPMQRFAERVADAALPDAKPAAKLRTDERAEIYREQVRVAWADGSLSRDERRMLDAMRERLGLTHEEAGAIEGEATR